MVIAPASMNHDHADIVTKQDGATSSFISGSLVHSC